MQQEKRYTVDEQGSVKFLPPESHKRFPSFNKDDYVLKAE